MLALFLLTAGLACLFAVFLVLWHRKAPGTWLAVGNTLALATWAIGAALQRMSSTAPVAHFWDQVESAGMAILPFLWLLYILHYTGRQGWLRRRNLALVCAPLLVNLTLIFTNESHHWMWRFDGPGAGAQKDYGAGILLMLVYAALLGAASVTLLARRLARLRGAFRWQVTLMLAATCLPWIGILIDLNNWDPFPGFNASSIALAATTLIAIGNVVRFRLGDLLPVAREAVLENIADGIIVLNREDRIVDINPAALRLFPPAARHPVGQALAEFWPGHPFPTLTADAAPVTVRWHTCGRTYDINLSPLLDERGQVFGRAVVLRDVNEREEVLRRQFEQLGFLYTLSDAMNSAEGLDALFERSLDGIQTGLKADRASILLLDSGGVMRFKAWRGLSDDYRQATDGHSPWQRDDPAPRPVLIHDTALEPADNPFRSVMLAEGIGALSFIPLVHGGKLLGKFMLYFNQPHRFHPDEIQLAQNVANHLAIAVERKRSDLALRESETRFRQLAENIDDTFWLLDVPQNRMVYVSRAHEAYSGYPAERQLENSNFWLELIHPDDRDRIAHAFEAHIQQNRQFDEEYRFLHADGTVRWAWTRAFLLQDESGDVFRVAGITKDITVRKSAEEDLRAALHEKEILLKEVHHRVKNNMQVISSLLNLQAGQVRDGAALDVLRDSQTRVRTMAMVHEKLYQSDSLAWIDFAAYTRGLATFLFSTFGAGKKGIRPVLKVDDIQLGIDSAVPCGLILNELISNALKHAFPTGATSGTGTCEVIVEFRRNGHQQLLLTVADTGVGFPQGLDYRQTTSLGMQLVCSLVQQLRGEISLSLDEGTRFEISFPSPL